MTPAPLELGANSLGPPIRPPGRVPGSLGQRRHRGAGCVTGNRAAHPARAVGTRRTGPGTKADVDVLRGAHPGPSRGAGATLRVSELDADVLPRALGLGRQRALSPAGQGAGSHRVEGGCGLAVGEGLPTFSLCQALTAAGREGGGGGEAG
ncbi:hypothetical protein chiPu_0022072 [Chiloscyllium punctatum]|uniref:Uncharacterized protein n=1 Tax=Chiloscyllium punctatum TaxID=137246 RepID=A0A401RJE0_CHIPU|nr:hypothetical protein [Chiloscyllium punctatum]